MNDFTDFLKSVFAFLLAPTLFYGASGAFIRAKKSGVKSWRQVCLEVFSGAVAAHASSDFLANYLSQESLPVVYFLVGWGGLEFISRVYDAASVAFLQRINRNVDKEK